MADAEKALERPGGRIERLCAWCGPAFGVLFAAGMFVAGLVPPPSAALGSAGIAHFYAGHAESLRWGMLLAMIAAPLIVPFAAVISRQIAASDARLEPLAKVQFGAAVILSAEILLFAVLAAAGAMRPDRSPPVLLGLNDVAFLFLLWAFAPGAVEFAAMGIAVLGDRDRRLFPPWSGWVDIAMAFIFALGGPTLFVTGGAFGWDGLLAFWVVFLGYAAWLLLSFWCVMRTAGRAAASTPA